MNKTFILHFEEGLPRTTAQQKGEAIRYKNGRPYIQHFRKDKVQSLRTALIYRMKQHAPAIPSAEPIKLTVLVCFDVKDRKLWGKYKTTRPDGDNYLKEIKDSMKGLFYLDDAQVCDERIIRTYAECGSIRVQIEDMKQPGRIKA